MVVTNPLTEEQTEALEDALDTLIDGYIENDEYNVSTYDGDYDYKVTFTEWTSNHRRKRENYLYLVWHEDKSDWEIAKRKTSGWLS